MVPGPAMSNCRTILRLRGTLPTDRASLETDGGAQRAAADHDFLHPDFRQSRNVLETRIMGSIHIALLGEKS